MMSNMEKLIGIRIEHYIKGEGVIVKSDYDEEKNDIKVRVEFENDNPAIFGFFNNIHEKRITLIDKIIIEDLEREIGYDHDKVQNEKAIIKKEAHENRTDSKTTYKRIIPIDEKTLRSMLEQQYGFIGFTHETHINNLGKILESDSFKCRSMVDDFFDSADQEVLKHTKEAISKFARFYFLPGTPTNFGFDGKNKNQMVYLIFDWDIIHENKSYFTDGNAGSTYSNAYLTSDYCKNPDSRMQWETIMGRGNYGLSTEDPYYSQKNASITRQRNAELLVKDMIPVEKYLRKIVFWNYKEQEDFVHENEMMYNKYKNIIVVDSSFFKH